MRNFESVLRDVERGRSGTPIRAPRSFSLAADLSRAGAVAHRSGRDAYASEAPEPRDLRALLLQELESARGSRQRLRDFRRRIAGALHPDRAQDAAAGPLLAELNAGIDAALKDLAS